MCHAFCTKIIDTLSVQSKSLCNQAVHGKLATQQHVETIASVSIRTTTTKPPLSSISSISSTKQQVLELASRHLHKLCRDHMSHPPCHQNISIMLSTERSRSPFLRSFSQYRSGEDLTRWITWQYKFTADPTKRLFWPLFCWTENMEATLQKIIKHIHFQGGAHDRKNSRSNHHREPIIFFQLVFKKGEAEKT